ncbi:MAG: flagellar hook-associated protein 3 [Gemmatimonadetes bacterium]|nr:flagellar hook-associated protein 3 [Gemmatimonadota bacterium]
MRINTNVSALTALSNLNKVQDAIGSSMQKLSSGFRINKAGDDAAGLGISNQMGADIKAMTQASRNAEQAGSVLQIMDGATSNVQSILERMKELAAQSASDTVDSGARGKIDSEFGTLTSELDRIVSTTKFQGASLLNGTFGSKVTNLGTVNAAAVGSLTGATHVGSVTVSTASTLSGIAGNVTASVVNNGTNTLGTISGATATLAVLNPTYVNGLTAGGNLTVTSTSKQTDLAGVSGGTNIISATVTAIAVGAGGSDAANAATLAPGTYHVGHVGAAQSGSTDLVALFDSNNVKVAGSDTTFNSNDVAITFAGTGVKLTVAGTTTAAAFDTATTTANAFTVKQEYNLNVSGGTPLQGAQAQQTVIDDGTAQTVTFSNYGINLDIASGPGNYNNLNNKTISVTADKAVQLDGTTTAGAPVTAKVKLNANPAAQNLDFNATFGVHIVLGAGATASNLGTEFTAGTNKIVQNSGTSAQFLVSSSQSYTGNDLISLAAIDLTSTTLGVSRGAIDLTTAASAQTALTTIDNAITSVGTAIGSIGAAENRVMYANTNVKTAIQNFTAAQSAIKDVDMAQEMTTFSKNQILSQASTAMLAQANQLGQSVLKLLQ